MNPKKLSKRMVPPLYLVIACIGLFVLAFIAKSEAGGYKNDTEKGQIEVEAKTIVIIGASYAESWNPEKTIAGYQVINKGVHGQQSFEILARFQNDVIALKPNAVIVWGFSNDVHRSDRGRITHTLRRTKENILAMVRLAKQSSITPILATDLTILCEDDWSEVFKAGIGKVFGKESYQDYVNKHVTEINRWIKDTVAREEILLLDLGEALADQHGLRAKESAQPDGRHISSKGYETLTQYIENSLNSSRATRYLASSRLEKRREATVASRSASTAQ